ncbi:MAG: DNA cytosine methyltransferase [Oscillospiraceae bacterium]|nr:DNA cytosine methyltransferase [Oscillospiraceae bacterium]
MLKFDEICHSVAKNIKTKNYRDERFGLFQASVDAMKKFEPLDVDVTASHPIQILDFFSGAGGTSLGFAAVNKVLPLFRFLGGCDINPISASSYSKNFGTSPICEDILEVADSSASIKKFLNRIGFDYSKPTILIGCAPCQGFSSHRKKHWSDEDDERNNLVIAFSRIVAEANPEIFVMENVPEFLSKRYWRYFSKALDLFKQTGYKVKQNIYNSAEFGVPQERFRSIIIGMKKKFLLPKGYLIPDEYKTVRNAIENLLPIKAGCRDSKDELHRAVAHKQSTIDVIKKVPHDGGSLPKGEGPKCLTKVNGFSDVYGRLNWDKPAITITHYARNPASGRFVHPTQDRGLTAREAARLQSFPDGFKFDGKSDDIYRQIGEAVPPLLSCGIAVDLLLEYLSNEPSPTQLEEETGIVELPVSNSYSSVIAGIKNTRRRT